MDWPDPTDFDAFAGPRAAALRPGRSWPLWGALLFSFAWFYWRRLYVVGSLMPLPFLLAALFVGHARTNGSLAIILTLCLLLPPLSARSIYALACRQRCRCADRLGLSGASRHAFLQQAGGVSWPGGLLAGTIWYEVVKGLLSGVLPHGWTAWLP